MHSRRRGSVGAVLKRCTMLLFIFSLSWPVCVHAQSATREEIKAAKKLYQKARKLLRKGETAEGIKLIADAERLHQHWSYPFGMAQLLVKAGENRMAWEALEGCPHWGALPNPAVSTTTNVNVRSDVM